MTAAHEGARAYLTNLFGADCSDLSDERAQKGVDSTYPGGWLEFSKGWGESPVQDKDFRDTVKAEPTRFQQMKAVQAMTGQAIRLGLLDEVLEIKIREDEIQVNLRVYKVVEQASRWKVVNQGLKRLRWEKDTKSVWNLWIRRHDEEVWHPEGTYKPHYLVNFGRIQTEDDWHDKRDQWHLCYRPGTSRSPMDGPYSLTRAGEFEYFDRYERRYYGADEEGEE